MIQQLLEGAENVIARAPHCWLITLPEGRGVNARPMGRVHSAPSQTDWMLWFLADARSEKVREIHSSATVRLVFEEEEDAFVSVAGVAEVIADAAVLMRRWRPSFDQVFPTDAARSNAVFVDIRAVELRLWIRGLTPEPFGAQSLKLHRPDGTWCIQSPGRF